MLKSRAMIVVDNYDVSNEYKEYAHLTKNVDVDLLFWGGCENDSIQYLNIAEDEPLTEWGDPQLIKLRNDIRAMLRKQFPYEDAILVEVSW